MTRSRNPSRRSPMDNYRLILIVSLGFVLVLLYQAWMQDYGPKPVPEQTQAEASQPAAAGAEAVIDAVPSAPAVGADTPAAGAEVPLAAARPQVSVPVVKVETDLLKLEISTRGGDLQSLLLRDYPVHPSNPEQKYQLLKPVPPNLFLAQSGLIGADPATAPTHEADFLTAEDEYRLAEGEDELVVPLRWSHPSGIDVIKRYRFRRGSYLVEVSQEIINGGNKPWAARQYNQLQRTAPPESDKQSFIYTYTGGAIYGPEDKYEKIDFDELAEGQLSRDVRGGWIAMIQHYFLSAWVPVAEQTQHLYSKGLSGGRYLIGMYSPSVTVPPKGSHVFSASIFSGPKLQDALAEVAPGLELAVDYGWLTVISQPLFWLLEFLHGLLGNWGWAIIFLTILIKLAFYKLSEASYKSMANMRRMTPRLQALKDRYGSDKQRLNQAMMEMYKKEKINPLGGCLPVVVQIPVFIALYWVLLESVEMRQAPFILWMNNLSDPDPYYILPLIMGVSMFIQQKLNPAPVDPMQAKIMMSLPVVFTVFFAFFPSGLVLYWVVNNILSIAQQWYITRNIEKAAAAH